MRNPPLAIRACPAPAYWRARSPVSGQLRLVLTLGTRHPPGNTANTPLGGGVSPRTRGGLPSDGSLDRFWALSGPDRPDGRGRGHQRGAEVRRLPHLAAGRAAGPGAAQLGGRGPTAPAGGPRPPRPERRPPGTGRGPRGTAARGPLTGGWVGWRGPGGAPGAPRP